MGNKETVSLLLERGADIEAEDRVRIDLPANDESYCCNTVLIINI
jgi:hypothetical protein